MSKIKPFLRWAGGKTWLTKYIQEFIPEEFNNYYEPFLGGGSMFFFLKSQGFIKNKSYLSDTNSELINSYRVVKQSVEELISILGKFKNKEEEYYKIREKSFDNDIERAARFIYLNKTSYNGIYRVNQLGKYNVPYGHRKTKDLFEFENMIRISEMFENTFFSVRDFKDSCRKPKMKDLIFLDPPYTVAHENNGFVQYNQSIFSWDNQIQLSEKVKILDTQNVNFILTNARHDSINELYNIGNKFILSRASNIGGNGAERKSYNEYIITNVTRSTRK